MRFTLTPQITLILAELLRFWLRGEGFFRILVVELYPDEEITKKRPDGVPYSCPVHDGGGFCCAGRRAD
jgi:hypothetical protein